MQRKPNIVFNILLPLIVFALVPSTLSADWVERIEVSIPFEFMVEGRSLPAGDYVLSTEREEPNILKIRSADGREDLLKVFMTPFETETDGELEPMAAKPRLDFAQVGEKNYLSEFHVPRRSMAWRVDLPEQLEARLDTGDSMKTSVEGREGR